MQNWHFGNYICNMKNENKMPMQMPSAITMLAAYIEENTSKDLSMYDILENYCARFDCTLDQTDALPSDEDDHDKILFTLLHFAADRNL